MFERAIYLLSLAILCLAEADTVCHNKIEYSECSTNKECGCLQRSNIFDDEPGICGLLSLSCSALTPCSSHGKACHDKKHVCIQHPLCDFRPLCYPLNKATEEVCPPKDKISTTTTRPRPTPTRKPFHSSCDWTRDGDIVLNQLKNPTGLFLSDDEENSIYVADSGNHRILKWTPGQTSNSPITVSLNGTGQLSYPRDVVINQKDGNMFICDKGNSRIVRWTENSSQVETFLVDVECESLILDKEGALIATVLNKDRVAKWEEISRTLSTEKTIAGGFGKGSNINQLDQPRDIFLDENDQSIYVADSNNHRVVKWAKGAKEGIVVAGGNGRGNGRHQLASPRGIALHPNGDLFIADTDNHRIVRWSPQATSGTVVVDGIFTSSRQQAPQPFGLIFDQHFHNLYVTDWVNSHLLRFFIDGTANCVTIT